MGIAAPGSKTHATENSMCVFVGCVCVCYKRLQRAYLPYFPMHWLPPRRTVSASHILPGVFMYPGRQFAEKRLVGVGVIRRRQCTSEFSGNRLHSRTKQSFAVQDRIAGHGWCQAPGESEPVRAETTHNTLLSVLRKENRPLELCSTPFIFNTLKFDS